MQTYNTIEFEARGDLGFVWLNRPEIHNAFNEVMISELLDVFGKIAAMDELRVIILRGRGKSFCAGADLNWMRSVAQYSYEQNYRESLNLAHCFHAIYTCPKPTIAVVHGAAIGGANGLLAACDIACCDAETVFSLSEVKIGIVPACISPYVVKRVGEYSSKELMLTGKRIKGPEAEQFRLVNRSLPADKLEEYLEALISLFRTSGPMAMAQCKKLLFSVANEFTLGDAIDYTARMIAEIRASAEGQEGMDAFLNKRKPNWIKQ